MVRALNALPACLLLSALVGAAADDSACADFGWDVTRARALFDTAPTVRAAGLTAKSAPELTPERLYELKLAAQSEVTFAAASEKPHGGAGARGGLARLTLATPGLYRIALDQGLWIDVVADGRLIAARDHQGRHGCAAPHKVVEFLLPAGTPLILQLSAGDTGTVRLALTRAPAR